jgi:hypothetical protein
MFDEVGEKMPNGGGPSARRNAPRNPGRFVGGGLAVVDPAMERVSVGAPVPAALISGETPADPLFPPHPETHKPPARKMAKTAAFISRRKSICL